MKLIALRDPWFVATCALVVTALVWMQYLAINHWMAGRWYLADVGSIQQALFNTMHGNFMWSPLVETNHYRYHFTPLLTALAPITLLSNYPIPLVTIYTIALACCPLPLYRIARQAGLPGALSFALGALFLGNHFVGSVQLAYHFETLMILLLLCTIAFARTAPVWMFACSAAGAMLVKEDGAAWCACIAVYLLLPRDLTLVRRGKWLLASSILMLLFSLVTIWLLGRGADNSATFYLRRAGEIDLNLTAAKSLALLILSTGGLCLLGGRSVLLLAVPALLLLSDYPFTQNLLYYYSYPFLPFLFLATVLGARRAFDVLQRIGLGVRHAATVLAFYLVLLAAAQLFLPTRTDGYKRVPVDITVHDELRLRVARHVLPADAPAVIQFGLWGVTPTRADAWQLSADTVRPERYIFADLRSPYGIPRAEYIALMRKVMNEVTSGQRKLLHSRDDIFVVGPRLSADSGSK